jgi:DDE family transposase
VQTVEEHIVRVDSLYGDGPTLEQLERYAGAQYIVGASKLAAAQASMLELPETCWRETGANAKRGWEASGVTTAWVQCAAWPAKRTIICRRWRNQGEMFWNHAALLTNLRPDDPRIAQRMGRAKSGFEEVVWNLYSRKQALENQWKELLTDLGLHHPPCARAAVNALFYGVAALAYNLSVGVRLIALEGEQQHMRLWRLRRDWFDVAGRVARHGREVVVRLLAACDERIDRLLAAMQRLARC